MDHQVCALPPPCPREPLPIGLLGAERMGRFDRVILRSSSLQPATIEQLGTEPLAITELTCEARNKKPVTAAQLAKLSVYPSDHYGRSLPPLLVADSVLR